MELVDRILKGSIDMHVHNMMMAGYRWNLVELAHKALEADMSAIVLKNYYGASSEIAYLVNHLVGRKIYLGSIVLNRWVGGLNPTVVKDFIGYGEGIKMVFMPTRHALHHLQRSGADTRNAVRLFHGNEMLPELCEVLSIIAENDLVLATGHISPEESLLLIQGAKKMGVKKIVVTHATCHPVVVPLDLQKEMVREGAFLEQSMAPCMPIHSIKMKQRFGVDVDYNTAKVIEYILEVGIEHCIVSSDFGQDYNPHSVDGLRLFIRGLLDFKLSPEQIKILVEHNPKKLLGMEAPEHSQEKRPN